MNEVASIETVKKVKEIPVISEWSKKRAENVIENIEILKYLKKNGTYLDVGVGDGQIIQIILAMMDKQKKSLKNYFSIDIENGILESVKKREIVRLGKSDRFVRKNAMNFILANAENVPFADNTFNGVSFLFSLHHMSQKTADKALRSAVRVVKKGGNIFVAEDLVGVGEYRERCESVDRMLNFEDKTVNYSYRDDNVWQDCFKKLNLRLIHKKIFETKYRMVTVKHVFYVLEK